MSGRSKKATKAQTEKKTVTIAQTPAEEAGAAAKARNNLTQKRKNQLSQILKSRFRPGNLLRRFSKRQAMKTFKQSTKNGKDKNEKAKNEERLNFQLTELQELQKKGAEITDPHRMKKNQLENLARLKGLTKNIARSTMKIRYAPYFNNINNLKGIYNSKSTKKNIFPTEERVIRLQLAAWNDYEAKKGNRSEFINLENQFNLNAIKEETNEKNSEDGLKKKEKEAFNELITTTLPAQGNTNIFQFVTDDVSKQNGAAFLQAGNINGNVFTAVDKLWGRHWKSGKSRYFSETKDGTNDLILSKEFNRHCTGDRLRGGIKGFYVHEHQAHERESSAKCCSLFENGQVAHNIGSGAEKSKSGGPTCGYMWNGKAETDTFEGADKPIA